MAADYHNNDRDAAVALAAGWLDELYETNRSVWERLVRPELEEKIGNWIALHMLGMKVENPPALHSRDV